MSDDRAKALNEEGLASIRRLVECNSDYHGSVYDQLLATIESDRTQIKELGNALGQVLVKAGVIRPDVPATGPMLLVAANDYVGTSEDSDENFTHDDGPRGCKRNT